MRETLCVAYASDDNYAPYLGVSMLSLFQTNRNWESIQVFVLDCGIGAENQELLRGTAADCGRDITFLPLRDVAERLRLDGSRIRIAVASYARLFLASALPASVGRVLYLDCDTLVCAPLAELWRTDLGSNLTAGVLDTVDTAFKQAVGLAPQAPYVNAGVLLINLAGWRKEGLETRFFQMIRQFDGQVPHHDQGTINGVCGMRKRILPPRYNVMSTFYSFSADAIRKIYFLDRYYTQRELDDAVRAPAIVHFTTGLCGRPWEEGCSHPARDAYRAVWRQSPWRDQPLLPDSRRWRVKLFTFCYRHLPACVFEGLYRLVCQVLHMKS